MCFATDNGGVYAILAQFISSDFLAFSALIPISDLQ